MLELVLSALLSLAPGWTVREAPARAPLPCPASSTRAGWPSRVLALGDGTFVKLWASRPHRVTVDARGHILQREDLGADGPADERALACGRDGRTLAVWTEDHDDDYRVRVEGQTVDTVRQAYAGPGLAVAFAPDGSALVAYSVPKAVMAVRVSRSGTLGTPFRLGPASEVTELAADSSSGGRFVIAWTTIDAGEERNERRRIYAVSGRGARFSKARLVDRAKHLNIAESTPSEIRLAVAPNGRAVLMWATTASGDLDDRTTVRLAEAGRDGRFGRPRQLTRDGTPGDVAIRSDGRTLAVWTQSDGLYAAPGERITDRPTEPRASFRDGKPHVEWRGESATRG
ncbi:hypothetical protein C8N24_4126 [Solirubrobacter pauli]|uniref:WD40 repeat protein n=1 Tax=Solirubrobacter pauli TaxID=166793 RepID=A0A660KWM6_9ACTN|nr:hypothetical protein [Solirubrobacter pauli]RKQ86117.1 hypothetical protein C8N24_4126 [Solirubrobacter pauli]